MRTVWLDTERCSVVMLREPFRLLERDGTAVPNAEGEPTWLGKVIVPGVAKSPYAPPRPGEARLKVYGSDPRVPVGPVALGGKVRVSKWYRPRRGGNEASSEITIRPDRVEAAPGATANLTGLLPVRLPLADGETAVVLDEIKTQSGAHLVTLMMPPSSIEGVVEIESAYPVASEDGLGLRNRAVTMTLSARLVIPDVEDLGQRTKSDITFVGTDWQPVEPRPGRGRHTVPDAPSGEAAA